MTHIISNAIPLLYLLVGLAISERAAHAYIYINERQFEYVRESIQVSFCSFYKGMPDYNNNLSSVLKIY